MMLHCLKIMERPQMALNKDNNAAQLPIKTRINDTVLCTLSS